MSSLIIEILNKLLIYLTSLIGHELSLDYVLYLGRSQEIYKMKVGI